MTNKTTSPTTAEASQLDGAARALLQLVLHWGELPAPYFTLLAFPGGGTELALQLEDPTAFEMWREVLELDAEDVQLHTNGSQSWLMVTGTVRTAGGRQVPVRLTGFGLPLSAVRDEAPAVAA